MRRLTDADVTRAMIKRGDEFVRALGRTIAVADPASAARIKEAFHELWAQYMAIAEQLRCQGCGEHAIPGERFCKACRKWELKRLGESGYLDKAPRELHRSADQKENTRETKYGRD